MHVQTLQHICMHVAVYQYVIEEYEVSEMSKCADPTETTDACSTVEVWSARKVPPSVVSSASPMASGATSSARMKFLHQMLDCFGPEHLVLRRYQLLGKHERRTGGAFCSPKPSVYPPSTTFPYYHCTYVAAE